jgi:FkbM family methyltransferase
MPPVKSQLRRIRIWLKRKLAWVVVPILGGPLKGDWFGLFTGTPFLKGKYGKYEIATFEQSLRPGDVVFDIGAHVGYFTLLASRLVGPQGRVFAFEPLPVNVEYLMRHVRANRLNNVEILPVAVGGGMGQMSLESEGGTGRGRLTATTSECGPRVPIVSLDAMLEQGRVRGPSFIKMDVEGAEVEALPAAKELISQFHPVILLSLHGDAAHQHCVPFLREHGYELTYLRRTTVLAVPRAA